jgi:redox-sensing transcriptional repressor
MRDRQISTNEKPISKAVIRRLPRYRRYLKELQKKDIEKISSKDLSSLIGYTASQIRQDLNNFGGFGQQGYGYSVTALHGELGSILGLNKKYTMVVVGYGRLGQAIASYISRNERNFKIIGIFDVKQVVEDVKFKNANVMTCGSLHDFIEKNEVDIAVITVPAQKAQAVADTVVAAGIKGIWNLTAADLDLPDNVVVENVHMSDSLHALAYYMGGDGANIGPRIKRGKSDIG